MNPTISYQYIQTSEQLALTCQKAIQQPVVALDTEFIRIRTFYPKLGLIQLFDGHQVSLIDPLTIEDFSPFIELLANKNVLKILHACGEDLEVFQHQFHQLPEPMLDTQVMANFLGIGVSMGFAKLVNHFLDITLDKGASRTDWLARPLSSTQQQYAAADVWYLLPVYHHLKKLYEKSPWQEAISQECQHLIEKSQTVADPNLAYKSISYAWQLDRSQLAVLQVLAKWRLEEAKKRNLAVNFVIKESSMFQIAKLQPIHTATLLEFMHPKEVRIHGKKLLWLVEQGKSVGAENSPSLIQNWAGNDANKKAIKELQQKLEEIKPLDLPSEIVASKRHLTALYHWHINGRRSKPTPQLLIGWRKEIGEKLLTFLD